MRYFIPLLLIFGLFFTACETPAPVEPKLIFKLKFDSTQTRLDAFGQPVGVAAGNAAQHPDFRAMSAHFIELVPTALTAVGTGTRIYWGAETTAGGDTAINFAQAIIKDEGEVFYEIPLKDVAAGVYPYIRVSVTYQNYDVYYNLNNVPTFPSGTTNLLNQKGTLASFVGFNTYITSIPVKNMTHTVNANKLQGYWAFETDLANPYNVANAVYNGQAQGTTVVNPLSASVATPPGSCLVTGTFNGSSLQITGNETKDIVVTLSFSVNKSFEWADTNGNGKLDIDAGTPANTELVVDMGLRGLLATFQ